MKERGGPLRSLRRLILPAISSLALIASCTDSTVVQIGPEDVASLTVSPDSLNVPIGKTLQISSHPLSESGTLLASLPTEWTSTDGSVASVDAGGLVTGLATGSAEIVARVGTFEASAVVTVAPGPSVVLSGSSVAFTGVAGGADPPPASVFVTNGGGFQLVGLAVDSVQYDAGAVDWLGTQLSASAAPATLTLTPMTTGITVAGDYTATVWLSALDADSSPAPIQASLRTDAGPATSLVANDGEGQSAAAGTAVAVAPSVLVSDAFGNAVENAQVTFSVTGGGGSLTNVVVSSDAAGIARVGSWTLGGSAGAHTLQASIVGASPVVFNATATPGAADRIQVGTGDGQSAVAGAAVPLPPAAVVVDALGNGVAGVAVSFVVTTGGGVVSGGTQTTDASGVATVGGWTLGPAVGPNTLVATATGVAGSATFTATALSGLATTLVLDAGDAQIDTVAATLSTAFSVRVLDNNSDGVGGVPVSWSVTGGGGAITMTSTTDGSGIATAVRVLGTTAGAQTATASVGGLAGSPVAFAATALPGAPAMVTAAAGDGQSATVNTAVATAPGVVVQDQFANPIAGHSVTFQVTGGGGVVAPLTAVLTGVDGIAAATSWSLGTVAAANNNTVTAQAAGAGLGGNPVTLTATATADVPASIEIAAGDGQTAVAGLNVATPPMALVRDQFGNAVPSATVTFAASGSGSVGSPTATTNGSGMAVTTWTVGTGGATMGADGSFPNTLTAGVQGTGFTVPFAGSAIYSYAQHIDPIWISGNCVGCHGGTSGLTFPGSVAGNYAAVTNVLPVCDGTLGTDFRLVSNAGGVQAADDFSILIRMIDTNLALLGTCDTRMPDASGLSAATVDTIRAWVRNGAPNND